MTSEQTRNDNIYIPELSTANPMPKVVLPSDKLFPEPLPMAAPMMPPPMPPINITINVNNGDDGLPIRPEVLDFAIDMETKLAKNDHKGGWGGMTVEELIAHVEDELGELKAAIELRLSPEEVRFEAADTANFLMMLADNYGDEHN